MAVSLSPSSRVRVTIVSTPRRVTALRGGKCVAVVSSCQERGQLSLKVVEYSGFQRQGRGFRSGRGSAACCGRQQFRRCAVVARLFNPEDFDPSKLTVKFEGNAKDIKAKSVGDILPRKYTLTHSDVTGDLLLTIGPSLNQQQSGEEVSRFLSMCTAMSVEGMSFLHQPLFEIASSSEKCLWFWKQFVTEIKIFLMYFQNSMQALCGCTSTHLILSTIEQTVGVHYSMQPAP